jgi:hypothetical protein
VCVCVRARACVCVLGIDLRVLTVAGAGGTSGTSELLEMGFWVCEGKIFVCMYVNVMIAVGRT